MTTAAVDPSTWIRELRRAAEISAPDPRSRLAVLFEAAWIAAHADEDSTVTDDEIARFETFLDYLDELGIAVGFPEAG